MDIKQYKQKIDHIYSDKEKIQSYEELFSQNDFPLETKEDWILYDEMFTSYWKLQFLLKKNAVLNDEISNDIINNAFNQLKSNLPIDKSIEDAESYDRMLTVTYIKDDYIQFFPERNSEDLRNRLLNFPSDLLDNDGNIIEFKKYDKVLREYMQFYMDEIDFSEVENCFEKLMNCSECKNMDIDYFFSYNFMKLEYEYSTNLSLKNELFYFTNKFRNRIALNVLSRLYEYNR